MYQDTRYGRFMGTASLFHIRILLLHHSPSTRGPLTGTWGLAYPVQHSHVVFECHTNIFMDQVGCNVSGLGYCRGYLCCPGTVKLLLYRKTTMYPGIWIPRYGLSGAKCHFSTFAFCSCTNRHQQITLIFSKRATDPVPLGPIIADVILHCEWRKRCNVSTF